MKKNFITLMLLLTAAYGHAQPAEGAYFTNTELQLHPRKVIAANGQIAYMWSDCYEQLNFAQRADLKLYYDSALAATNKQIESLKLKKQDYQFLQADSSFYSRKILYIKEFDEWEAKN